MDRLSLDDSQILRLETEAIKGHTLKVLVVGPRPDGSRIGLDELRAEVASRLGREPRSRRRVVFPAGSAGDAVWADDPEFEVANHVAEVGVAEPVDGPGLLAEAASLFEQRLDHDRPLWRLDLVPMIGNSAGLVMRIHHCLADGITSQRFARALFWDDEPDPPPAEPEAWTPSPEPPALDVAGRSVARRIGDAPGTLAGAIKGARGPSRWVGSAREMAKLPSTVARELLPLGGESVLDQRIGPRREIAAAWLDLDELKGIAHLATTRLGGHVTLNDVLLVCVAGGLRSWLSEQGAGSHGGLRAQVPVSLHGRSENPADLGNRDSFINVDLRLDIADPFERMRVINAATARCKEAGDAQELYDFFHAISRFRPLYRGVTRLASGPRDFAISISNVPGPADPVFVLGVQAAGFLSVAEPADRHALRVAAVSYAGALAVGLASDPEALQGIGALAAKIEAAAAELAIGLA